MINKKLQVKCLRVLTVLLTVAVFTNGTVYAKKQQSPAAESINADAEILLVQLKEAAQLVSAASHRGDIESEKLLSSQIVRLSSQIVRTWPETTHAMDALGEVGYLYAFHADDVSVATITDQLYAQYSMQSRITRVIDRVAQGYLKYHADRAQTIYTEAINRLSAHSDVAWLHGAAIRSQMKENDFSQAKKSIEKFKNDYSEYPGLCAVIQSLADTFWNWKDYDKAKELYQYISQNSSDTNLTFRAQRGIARFEIRFGNDRAAEQAINTLKTNYAQHNELCSGLNSISWEYLWKRDYVKAKDLWQYIEQKTSDSSLRIKALYGITCCQLRLGDDKAAEQAITTLKNDYPDSPELCNNILDIVEVYGKLDKFAEAKALCQHVAQNSSNSGLAIQGHAGVVRWEIRLGNEIAAGQELDRLLSKYLHNSDLAANLKCLEKLYVQNWCKNRILNLVQNGQKPSVKKRGLMLCIELLGDQDVTKAIERYSEAFLSKKYSADDLKELLAFCEKEEKYSSAVQLCQNYLKGGLSGEDKKEIELQLYTNWSLCIDNPALLLPHLDEYILKNKTTHKTLTGKATFLKGRALMLSGDTGKAIDLYKKATAEYPNFLEAQEGLYLLGYCYLLQNEFDRAKEMFNQFLKKYPENKNADEAKRLLKRINDLTT